MSDIEPYQPTENQLKMLAALAKHRGVVSPAVGEAGIARSTHYEWVNTIPEYAALVAETKEIAHDFVESMLFSRIEEGSDVLIKYYASTQMKSRGYGENLDLTTKGESLNTNMFELFMLASEKADAEQTPPQS